MTILGIDLVGNSVTLPLADLCVGASYIVLQTPDLLCDCWTEADAFIAESVVMDWGGTVEEGVRQSFYRILSVEQTSQRGRNLRGARHP